MAGTSISALASLLVATTSFRDEHSATTDHARKQRAHHHDDSTHPTFRVAVRSGAARKARALSRHRPVLVRWAPATTYTSPQQQQQQRRRSQNQDEYKQADGNIGDIRNIKNNGNRASSGDVPPTAAAADRTEEIRPDGVRATPSLSLLRTESLGRHVVAGTGGVPVGTVVLREAPYAWALNPEFHGEICAECLHEIADFEVICPDCGQVAYCSAACATAALRTWHGSECLDNGGATFAVAMSGMSPSCRVALRAFRRARQEKKTPPIREGESEAPPTANAAGKVEKVPDTQGLASTAYDGVVSSPACGEDGDINWPAVRLAHLQEHYTERSARERELLETEAAVAAVLANSGGSSEKASSGGKAGKQPCELLAAELVTSLFKVSTNGFAVSFLRGAEPAVGPHVQSLTHAKVAVGLYLAAAMLNHSCRPNALVTFHGREMRVVVTRAVAEGEPVTISYGPLASKVSSTSERRAYLRQAYFFQCECVACCPPPSTPGITSPRRPDDSNDSGGRQSVAHDCTRAAAAACSKRTEFACVDGERDSCPGTLLVGTPPLSCEASAPASSSTNTAKRKVELWCDHCGNRMSSDSANQLLKEDEEDRRLWDEAVEAASRFEKGGESNTFDGGRGRDKPPAKPAPAGGATSEDESHEVFPSASPSDSSGSGAANASPLRLVVERVKWRDARLSPLSLRRATAHDMHARILAGQMDFAGAADACARALSVLVKRFAPEDQELGTEFLKLAGLCFNAGWMDKCYRACRKARLSLGVLDAGDEQLVALNNLQVLCAESHR